MSERLGKWYPSDLDGGFHYYERKKLAKKTEGKPQLNIKSITLVGIIGLVILFILHGITFGIF